MLCSIFAFGIISSLYLWIYKKYNNTVYFYKGNHKTSIFNNTIHKLKVLECPKNINYQSTELYYLSLSSICRLFIKETFFIRATEMTTNECTFCHSQTCPQPVEDAIKAKGYFILKMEGCP